MVRALERDATAASVQPNYLFALQQTEATSEGDAAQYELAKLRLPQAHKLAKGDNVRVALIDSAVDLGNAELADSIADTFDTLASAPKPHKHGTAIAGLIAAHGRLMGAAPAAKLLAVRAFDPDGRRRAGHHLQYPQRSRLGGGQSRAHRQYEFRRAGRSDAAPQPASRA